MMIPTTRSSAGPGLAALSLGLVLQLAGCAAHDPAAAPAERDLPPPDPPGVVKIADASRQFLEVQAVGTASGGEALRAPARVEFRDTGLVPLPAPLAGRVLTVHVQTGDSVRAGDPLVTLDCPDAASARAAVATTTAALDEARSALERQTRMMAQGVGIERERLEAATRVRELDAEAARAAAAAAFSGGGTGATVVLRAPVAGTVVARAASPGQAVAAAGEPLVTLGDPRALWVVADVFEADLNRIAIGAGARVTLPSIDGPLEAHVVGIGATVADGARTAPVRLALAATGHGLRPGMFGRAAIDAGGGEGPMLPAEAVLIKGAETVVYVETSPTTFERRTVTVGPAVDGRVRVVSGLKAGDRVVVHGALLLDGSAEQLS